jgi:hypothetical protein
MVTDGRMPNNECGGCTACCVIMPVLSEDFCKQAGKPCQHLVPGGCGGCGIYADRPPVCRDWLCTWRWDMWLGRHPDYRPDRLGVMFSHDADDNLTVWEVTPGALADPRVQYLINRLKRRYAMVCQGVRRYPLKVLDDQPRSPEMLAKTKGDLLVGDEPPHRWVYLGGGEYVLQRVDSKPAAEQQPPPS